MIWKSKWYDFAEAAHTKETATKNRSATIWSMISLCCATAVVVLLLFFPIYSNGATIFEANGRGAGFPILVPVLVAAMAVLIPGRITRTLAATVLVGFVVIAGFSVGLFYVPAMLAMVFAAAVPLDQNEPRGGARPSRPVKGIIYTDTEIEEFRRNGVL